ncbi:MAG: Com family DNA-binding transcriptional regulator [Eubacteriales bacterium]|nr:Com family DNA-binding transcriptional regulator [Eubacteriales bacterium]MDO5549475.1 Com family DNA-binding transcriptional regulator [Eubacteriales bacterium]
MTKIKCTQCGQTLLFARIFDGEIKCPRCGTRNVIRYPKWVGQSLEPHRVDGTVSVRE